MKTRTATYFSKVASVVGLTIPERFYNTSVPPPGGGDMHTDFNGRSLLWSRESAADVFCVNSLLKVG